MIEVDPALVDDLHNVVGDRLRSVAIYDPDGYVFEHLRSDIRESYSNDEIEAVFDDPSWRESPPSSWRNYTTPGDSNTTFMDSTAR